MNLKGKKALITGASRGIGRAIALKFAEAGADLALVYAGREDAARQVAQECQNLGAKAFTYKCDVSDFSQAKETVAAAIRDLGGLDILLNNAGITIDKLVMTMLEEDFDRVVAVNLKGAFNMIKHTYMHFAKQRGGRIINISSVSGLAGNAGQANYASAKAALVGLTKSLAKELASRSVTCNCIAPGFIRTDMTDAMPDNIREQAVANIPLKRMGNPEDVAAAALFLASDLSSYITGEVIKVDGGLYI
ncbi:MAG: 3-oxoacyl-[acyl-carrier-protein] reductase [Clostridiales bacterium]|mgnify:CR=1 FL=1|jgi:3-oxoacyl-[acyl-carrier protein] reductase|nr:3-oxoacyl-[acyl-carrier-protein] reductase [Clostridiales bacterium]